MKFGPNGRHDMGNDIVFEIAALLDQQGAQTSAGLIRHVASVFGKYYPENVVVYFDLIAETGGVPRKPPVCFGPLNRPKQSQTFLANASHVGMLGKLIRRWRTYYIEELKNSSLLRHGTDSESGYEQFIENEQIETLLFLPLYSTIKTGALLVNLRRPSRMDEEERIALDICRQLIGTQILLMRQRKRGPQVHRSSMATAHTLYNEIAIQFRSHIESLEAVIADLHQTPDAIQLSHFDTHLKETKTLVFEMMRNLVIEASGELLVDLESMSLHKALNMVAAAIIRGRITNSRINISIQKIPQVIERQPVELRKLLYAFILEALGNAIKHGGPAPFVNIELSWHSHYIYIEVIDHGQGFEPENVSLSEHGLGFWQDHIKNYLTGTLSISSKPGLGAVVSAKIPVIPNGRARDVVEG